MAESQSKQGIEVTDPGAYIADILAALGDRDPLEIYGATPGELRQRIGQHPADVLRQRPFADRWTWTPLEVIGHLVDAEWSIGWRTRAVFCDDQPQLIGIGQDNWARELKHNDRDPEELVEEFTALRTINLRFWRSIPDDKLSLVGLHNERGEEALGDMLRLYAAHDVYHLQQLDRYLQAITSS
jgi:hypothetical protein